MSHTPAPWSAYRDERDAPGWHRIVVGGIGVNGRPIAYIVPNSGYHGRLQCAAGDAALCAAAPDMLAVLKDALAFIEDEIIRGDPDDTGDDAFSFKASASALADRIMSLIKQAAP